MHRVSRSPRDIRNVLPVRREVQRSRDGSRGTDLRPEGFIEGVEDPGPGNSD